MNLNTTSMARSGTIVQDYYADNFPLASENDDLNMDFTNQTYYDEYILNTNQTLNFTNSDVVSLSSLISFSSPFSYILLILVVYLVLTLILLSLSLYKQRQVEMENFYFGDTQEDIESAKRCLVWKQLLIERIRKGDMEPLLIDTNLSSDENKSELKMTSFPLETV